MFHRYLSGLIPMPDDTNPQTDKALHQLMEDEFQRLVDIIEQKRILHEDLDLQPVDEDDPILEAAVKLQNRSEELGAETLAEFFSALEDSTRSGDLEETAELLQNITEEFESVKQILDAD